MAAATPDPLRARPRPDKRDAVSTGRDSSGQFGIFEPAPHPIVSFSRRSRSVHSAIRPSPAITIVRANRRVSGHCHPTPPDTTKRGSNDACAP